MIAEITCPSKPYAKFLRENFERINGEPKSTSRTRTEAERRALQKRWHDQEMRVASAYVPEGCPPIVSSIALGPDGPRGDPTSTFWTTLFTQPFASEAEAIAFKLQNETSDLKIELR